MHDRDFDGGGDRVRYRVGVDGAAGPLTVNVEPLYQTVSHRFVADLASTPTPEVARLASLLAGADRAPALVATATATLR